MPELFESILMIGAVVALSAILSLLLKYILRDKLHVLRILGTVLIWAVGFVTLLAYFGVKTEVLMLLIGLAGISLVLSSKPLVSSWMAMELFIKAQKPFKIGDNLSIGGVSGRVINLNSLVTVLATQDGHIIYYPNHQFLECPFKVVGKEGVRVRLYFTIPHDKFEEFKMKISEISFEVRSDLIENEMIEVFAKTLVQDKFIVELVIPVRNPNKKEDVVSQVLERLAEYL